MLGKYVSAGNKIELHPIRRDTGNEKTHISKINQVLEDDKLEILMPVEGAKIVLLARNIPYDLVIYTASGLYQCKVKVGERYKSGNVYLQQLELLTGIKKYQRREYYRHSCSVPVFSRQLTDEEKTNLVWDDTILGKEGESIDLGGGGVRFYVRQEYEPDDLILCVLKLELKDGIKEIQALGKVLNIKQVPDVKMYEVRVQFEKISNAAREQIIQYIFEDERKRRKKSSGL